MIKHLKQCVAKYTKNVLGWSTHRKIVVIESDDWGSIRMPSRSIYDYLLNTGFAVDQSVYNRYDCLESNEDLEALFSVLARHKDANGSCAKITANTIVANPDFDAIAKSEYTKYKYEKFSETLKKYPDSDKVMMLYKQGIQSNLFFPQLHGREHINVDRWMRALREGDKAARTVFDLKMFTVSNQKPSGYAKEFLDALGGGSRFDIASYESILEEGVFLFKDLFGYSSKSFIASCYIWHSAIERKLHELGIKFIQGTHAQRVPCGDHTGKIKVKYHYQGQKNNLGQRYLVRNVFFEPVENFSGDSVDSAMKEISEAYKWNKPAIISSHRVNYIGSIDVANRDRNLKQLSRLLSAITMKWPQVEFLTTAELGDLMEE